MRLTYREDIEDDIVTVRKGMYRHVSFLLWNWFASYLRGNMHLGSQESRFVKGMHQDTEQVSGHRDTSNLSWLIN